MYVFMLFRYVDENGNNYNVTMDIMGPYGSASIFTGPKVRVDQLITVVYVYNYVICTYVHMYLCMNVCSY